MSPEFAGFICMRLLIKMYYWDFILLLSKFISSVEGHGLLGMAVFVIICAHVMLPKNVSMVCTFESEGWVTL